ncbi:hypothetical protein G4X40_18505 [Rhodococcus sp. D2-41]|uniref:hypothetical protein n=1 Tax=Speluncibacter jeojiensis TaxID=2710754 RepID=UPI0024106D6B|nr:hypothetical protein [Rhodococcus sp. D2-41]MDG3012137.1 hypothetical protein [Rhodococcus sp. D2-41]
MSALMAKWPAVRQAVYAVLAAVLATGAAVGWITSDQSDQWLGLVAQVLGAAGLVVAVLHVDRTPAPAPKSAVTLNVPDVESAARNLQRAQLRLSQAQQRVVATAAPVIAQGAAAADAARRDLERRLGG